MINGSLLFQLSRLNLKWLFIYHLNYKNINYLPAVYNIILKYLYIVLKYKISYYLNIHIHGL